MLDPRRCDPEVWSKGRAIFVTHTISAEGMDGWVGRIAERAGQPVDWGWMGGRAVVKCLGDRWSALGALIALLPEHDDLFRRERRSHDSKPSRWFPPLGDGEDDL